MVMLLSGWKQAAREIFDGKRFRENYKNYLLLSFLILVSIGLVLLLHELLGGIIVASLGASSFILFVRPHASSTCTRNIAGSYVCASVVGILFSLLHDRLFVLDFAGVDYALVVVCAAAAAVTAFLMVAANLVHPPAAALAVGLSADSDCLRTAAVAIIGVVIFCVIRRVLKKHLKNLI